MAVRFAKLVPENGTPFPDVSDDHWAATYINTAHASGWVGGYDDGTFRPNQNITRAEVVKIANSMLDRLPEAIPASVANPYNDVNASHWAYIHIMEASLDHSYYKDEAGVESWEDVTAQT
jgi:hypothetical protein